MQHEEILENLAEIRRIAKRLRQETGIPSLDRAMNTIEIHCHLVQWQLGGTHETVPALYSPD